MKKTILLLSFLMLSSLLSMGQNVKHVSLDFNMDDFMMQRDNTGSIYVLSNALNYFFKSDTLLPALPYIGCNVLVGSNEEYDSHTGSGSRILFQNGVVMARNPKAIPTNRKLSSTDMLSAVSYSQSSYPSDIVEYVGMNECDSYRVLSFIVCPFEYDATSKKLYFRSHIDLDINLGYSLSVSQTRTGNRETVRNTIRKIVVNPEDLDEQQPSAGIRSNNNLTKQTGFEYVIVTSNQFKNIFQQLASWKSRKGIRSKVLTVEDIASTYTGSTTMEKIKKALDDIDSLSYVLLGGDKFTVPTCMVYIGLDAEADSITPADVYYSCLASKNWDSNNNGVYGEQGELNDSISLLPVLHVSRAPVSTVDDAQRFVSRIINYECAPNTTYWNDSILMCGTSLDHHYPYGQSDTEIWSRIIFNEHVNPSWPNHGIHFYDTHTDFPGDANYNFNNNNLQEQLVNGYTFVNVMTHGSKTYWTMENGQNYNTHWADSLNNSSYTIIMTSACLTNAFDFHASTSNCLSWHFINNPNSGVLAYLGASRENWYDELSSPPFRLSRGHAFCARIYDSVFADRYHRLAKALTDVKSLYITSAMGPNYPVSRKLFMEFNLMGDPEMPIYLSKPKNFNNVSLLFVNDSIYVDAGIGGFDICFINQSDSTDFYISKDIADSLAVFKRVNGIQNVCITKPGYIPYTTTCADTYIQNKIFTGLWDFYETGNAMIGSDVTNKVAQGPVVVNNANITVKASQGATITKNFEVQLGATFTITN